MTEWPTTWRLIGARPLLADILCDDKPLDRLALADGVVLPGSMGATKREVQRIVNTPELMELTAGSGCARA